MEQRPPSDGTFALVPSAEPGIWDFKIAINYGTPRPDSGIAAGTTYAAAVAAGKIPNPCNTGTTWDAYVAAQREQISGGLYWQFFARALPATPNQAQFLDLEIWGPAKRLEYLDLISNTRPDRADLVSVGDAGEWEWNDGTDITWNSPAAAITCNGQEYVQDVQEADLGNGLCQVTLVTVPGNTKVITETSIDESSGDAIDRTTTYTLSATKPAGAAVDDTGYGTTVDRVSHNLWKSTRAKLHGLPTAADPLTWDTEKSMPIVWPAVMLNPRFVPLGVPGSEYFQYKLVYARKESYSSPVPCNIRQWWQKEAPAPLTRTDMIAGGGRLGSLQPIDVPETLHPLLEFEEPGLTLQSVVVEGQTFANVAVFRDFTYRLAATSLEDWPETYPLLFAEPRFGGFLCTLETYSRPESVIAAEVEIGTTQPDYESFLFHPQ